LIFLRWRNDTPCRPRKATGALSIPDGVEMTLMLLAPSFAIRMARGEF
jgi:hypothetical protein